MDGFNVIPVDKDTFKSVGSNSSPSMNMPPNTLDNSFEIIDEDKEKAKAQAASQSGGMFLFFSIVILVALFAYWGFLVYYRVTLISQIVSYGSELRNISKNIDVKEMQDFQAMDSTLKAINGRLSKHVLGGEIMSFINLNIRKTLQITEYRMDVNPTTVDVNLTAVSPSFKELAEQTEKFFQEKEKGNIKSFAVSNMSFEADTRKIKFSLKIVFDRSKVSAVAFSQTTN